MHKEENTKEKIYSYQSVANKLNADVNIEDLIDIARIKKIFINFRKLTGIGMTLTNAQNEAVISVGLPDVCTKYYRKNPESAKICRKSDEIIKEKLDKNKPGFFKCLNGMWDIAHPIMVDGKQIASLYFGQFFYEDEEIDFNFFNKEAEKYGFDSGFIKSLKNIPRVSKEKAELIVDLLADIAQTLAETGKAKLILKREKLIAKHEAMNRLEENRQISDLIFNNSPVAKILVDRKVKIVQINEAAKELSGSKSLKLKESGPGDFLNCISSFDSPTGCGSGDDCNTCSIRKCIRETFANKQAGAPSETELYINGNGKLKQINVLFSTAYICNTGEELVLVNIEDITEKRKNEKAIRDSRQKLDAFFKQSLDGFFFMMIDKPVRWDHDTDKDKTLDYVFKHQRITKVNNALLEQYGFDSKDEYIGLTPADFFAHDIEYGKKVWRKFFDKGKLHIETDERRKDGQQVWIEGDYLCMYDNKGRITGHFGVQRDVSEKKKIRRQIEESNKALKAGNAAKDKFFSIIAHDLRGPFGAMLGFTEMLKKTIAEKDYRAADRQVDMLYKSAKHNYALLLNLLDWSRTQTGRIDFIPKKISANKLIQEIISVLEYSALSKSIKIKINIPKELNITADKNMLETIIRNLTGNAIKYSETESIIELNASADSDNFYFSIKDSGVGISPENQKKLFRIDSGFSTLGTKREKGTGLGLILCKEFVEKHQGKLQVDSTEGKGSVFSFNIPQ